MTPTAQRKVITFPQASIAEFGRVDHLAGWIKWKCAAGNEIPAIKLTGPGTLKLVPDAGTKLKVKSPDGTVSWEAELEIEFSEIVGFQHKHPADGPEFHFTTLFPCRDGASIIEAYMVATGNAPGALKLSYQREAVQATLTEQETTNV